MRALKAGSLATRQIEPVLIDSEDQVDAFLAHRIDAVVTREPDRARLLAGGAKSLFDSTQAPGTIVDVLVVPHDVATERVESLHTLVDAWLAAIARLKDDRAATIAKLAAVESVDANVVEQALGRWRLGDLALNREMLGGSSPKLAATLADIEALAAGAGLTHAERRGGIRFDSSFLPTIVSGGAVAGGAR